MSKNGDFYESEGREFESLPARQVPCFLGKGHFFARKSEKTIIYYKSWLVAFCAAVKTSYV